MLRFGFEVSKLFSPVDLIPVQSRHPEMMSQKLIAASSPLVLFSTSILLIHLNAKLFCWIVTLKDRTRFWFLAI
ncbi:hypothetical protein SDJN02_03431 [Cucurbita argyrosperma subsp. argyrosperma]|nr:hypothetical protein SDJN02_03431 [Cucurbita argyrosperma subsp. argyrosperma]